MALTPLFKSLSVAISLSPLLYAQAWAAPASEALAKDLAQGKALFDSSLLVQAAVQSTHGECCWIRVEKGFDGNRVTHGRIYVTTSVSQPLAAYVLNEFDTYTYDVSREAVKAFYTKFKAHCAGGLPSENAPLVHVYYDGDDVECVVSDALLRSLPN